MPAEIFSPKPPLKVQESCILLCLTTLFLVVEWVKNALNKYMYFSSVLLPINLSGDSEF